MFFEELQIEVLKLLVHDWPRVIAFDVESKVPSPSSFLTNERILSISFARRDSGGFGSAQGIETKTLFLNEETDESETNLLKSFDSILVSIRPLCVIGYGLRQYDIPLLCVKKQRHSLLLWKLIDMCESAVHIDLYHLLKYKHYKKFDDALNSPEFSHLPLKKTKGLVPTDRNEKSKEIYRLWKEDRERLRRYAEGEVHDMLLIAEEILKKGLQTQN
jgi:DNA polymerase elongation subunit (family B)